MKGGTFWLGVSLVLILANAGCERATVAGIVVDERGERLPGVAVTVEGTRSQALTDAMGEYAVQFRPRGLHILQYRKSGFTPGMLELEVDEPRTADARNVELWRVPPNAGIFVLDEYRFEPLAPIEVSVFDIAEGGPEQGTQREPEYTAESGEPLLILYKLPIFDLRIARLESRPIQPEEGEITDTTPTAWVLAEPMAVDLVAMDQPEGVLQRLVYEGPLAPGVYAVHWGALYGDKGTEPRIFMFEIPDAEAEPAAGDDAADQETGEAEDDAATGEPEPSTEDEDDPNAPSEG